MNPRLRIAARRTTSLLALAAVALATSGVHAETPAAVPPGAESYGTFGIDLSGRDLKARPGDDFERHASGGWLDTHPIPAERPAIGTFNSEFETAQARTRELIGKAPAGSGYGALYQSFMDEARVDSLGAAPVLADIATVRALPDKSALARFMGGTGAGFGLGLFAWNVQPDYDNPGVNVLAVDQSGLGLPERDFYLDARFKKQLDAYTAYVERTLRLIGDPDPTGNAAKVLAFETAAAKVSWSAAQQREVEKLNNPMSPAELAAFAPGVDWAAWFAGIGIAPQSRVIVEQKSAIHDLAALYAATPLDTLKAWEAFHVAEQASPYLAKPFVDSRFELRKALYGVSALDPRWKRGVNVVNAQAGEWVGKDYVSTYFTPADKARMVTLVGNLKAAMGDRIRSNAWMSPATKTAALDKLGRMDVFVGYPDKWRDWSALQLRPDDLYGNVKRTVAFNAAYALSDLGKPVDHAKWGMVPQEVNAYNGFTENKIVFPAGILQPPMFNPAADDAVNYGAIGAVIGHEISHGFDDQGRKVDATGKLRDWWTREDAARFDAQAKIFGDQYAKFEAAPGMFINPALTMGENIADYAGLLVAYDAYHKSLGGKRAPVIDGLTGDQRFFLAYAQVWRSKMREDLVKQSVASDPHSPDRFRVLGPLPNIDAWYAAFGVKPGDKMYIAPEQRARIW